MKRFAPAAAACALSLACSDSPPGEPVPVASSPQALNGALIQDGNLTRPRYTQPDENARQADTEAYYNTVGVSPTGNRSAGTIRSRLATLSQFTSYYGFGQGEGALTAYYYNRGDLGIGREMHCVDHTADSSNQQIACYVKNFAAGDDGSEFTFGSSASIAYANMASGNEFATVAMVYRNRMTTLENKVIFIVYDKHENLAGAAALDRHGLSFANAFEANGRVNPDPAVHGTPGVNFNNHIPSNCTTCHGGRYSSSTHSQRLGLFLPFDLDQFEYEDMPGRRRDQQRGPFKRLNQVVRKVAALAGSHGKSIKNQIDGWYDNVIKTTDKTEVLEGEFNSAYVPSGWTPSAAGQEVYREVVRPYCRSCHIANTFNFDAETTVPASIGAFRQWAPSAAVHACNYTMPHALQTTREFWVSPAPAALERYLRSIGQATYADILGACGPGDVVTLDPHLITASAAPL